MSNWIPESVCPGTVGYHGLEPCPRNGAVGKVNSVGMCSSCARRVRRREAGDKDATKRREQELKKEFAMHTNLLKLLNLVDTLRGEGALTGPEAQTIRAIVQRHLIDLAVELGDAPAGLDVLRPESATEAIAADQAKKAERERLRIESERKRAEQAEAEYAEWERDGAERAAAADYTGASARAYVNDYLAYLDEARRRCGTVESLHKVNAEREGARGAKMAAEKEAAAEFHAVCEAAAQPVESAEAGAEQTREALETIREHAEQLIREIAEQDVGAARELSDVLETVPLPVEPTEAVAGESVTPAEPTAPPDGLDAEDRVNRKTKAAAKRERFKEAAAAVDALPKPAAAPELPTELDEAEEGRRPELTAAGGPRTAAHKEGTANEQAGTTQRRRENV